MKEAKRLRLKKPKHTSNKLKLNKKHKQMLILGSFILALVFVISMFFLWPPQKKQDVVEQKPKETIVPTPDITPDIKIEEKEDDTSSKTIREGIKKLYNKNNDTVGYIYINDTKIDYPVVGGKDNVFYLFHDFNKKESKKGSIFLDYRCDITELSHNVILYGHHMKDGSMFAELKKYKEQEFYDSHRIITFDTLYEECKWEVFAVYITDTKFYYINTDFGNDNEWLDFTNKCQEKSIYEKDIELKADDIILTLSTCTYEYNDARLVVQARMIK